MIQEFLPDGSLDHILAVIQSQDLNRVGIAVQKQIDQFAEGIDDRICLCILILIKRCQADQVRREIQCDPAEIDIAALTVRSITITAKLSSVFTHLEPPPQVVLGRTFV